MNIENRNIRYLQDLFGDLLLFFSCMFLTEFPK